MNFPTIPSIRSFEDVKKALESIRVYFTSLTPSVGNVEVTQPSTIAKLTVNGGKELKVLENWELRGLSGELPDQVIDTKKMVEIVINGQRVKLAVLK